LNEKQIQKLTVDTQSSSINEIDQFLYSSNSTFKGQIIYTSMMNKINIPLSQKPCHD